MRTYTLKLIRILETGSIGRQLKATITANGVPTSFGFKGTSGKHHLLIENIGLHQIVTLPINVLVKEWDAKKTDEPYIGSTSITIDPTSDEVQTEAVTILIKEIGGSGENKNKTATLTFRFEAKVTGCIETQIKFADSKQWLISKVDFLGPIGSVPTYFKGYKITWEATVIAICKCGGKTEQRKGIRILEKTFDSSDDFFVGYT
ncbi:MAG: hypothetical protein ACR2H1_06020, partial [Limisphaerales bacterium]